VLSEQERHHNLGEYVSVIANRSTKVHPGIVDKGKHGTLCMKLAAMLNYPPALLLSGPQIDRLCPIPQKP
jgi:hypothetical protein